MATLSLSSLGPFQATLDGEPLHRLTSKRGQALLIYLAVEATTNPGGVPTTVPSLIHRRESLMSLLWPGMNQKSAQASLRQLLYLLRQAIPEVVAREGEGNVSFLLADRDTVQVNPTAAFTLDVATFRQLTSGDPTQAQLEEATTLYQGDFLAGFFLPDSSPFEEWVAARRADLRRRMLAGLDALTSWNLGAGDLETAERHARRQLEIDNLRESAHRQLMELLARNGRRREALSHYETCRQLLHDELGIEPAAETQALVKAIRSGELSGGEKVPLPPSPSHLPVVPHNLPPQPTPFIGREKELAELDALIADPDTRLITIVGPGGIGKTRLALAYAERVVRAVGAPPFQGVFFVDLAPLDEIDQIVPTLATALNFQLQGGEQGKRSPKQQILDYLRRKQMLLIVDNFEHLVDASQPDDGAGLVAEILGGAPEVQVLVTSRERLQLRQEQLYSIQGREFPDWETAEDAAAYTAVRLFLQSARRNRPDFDLTTGDSLTYLARICRLVAGMPLAIELAAAWVDMLSLEGIAGEVGRSLDFLETAIRDVPDRHRSIRAVFDNSWRRLDETEREIFLSLSVFRGGFTRPAAQEVMGASLHTLARLVNKSLLQYSEASDRYQVHELLRQYAAEKLAMNRDSEVAARDGHCVICHGCLIHGISQQ